MTEYLAVALNPRAAQNFESSLVRRRTFVLALTRLLGNLSHSAIRLSHILTAALMRHTVADCIRLQ